jgi:hypothetical protein
VRLPVDDDLGAIVAEIVNVDRTQAEWTAIESDDMFQRGPYAGGYDADERAFVFSCCEDRGERWFQFTLDEARAIVSGRQRSLSARPANR